MKENGFVSVAVKLGAFFLPLLMLAVSTVHPPSSERETVQASSKQVSGPGSTYLIGDSITLRGSIPYLNNMRPRWQKDYESGRGVGELPERVDFMIDRVGYPKNIVLALGSNPARNWTKAKYERIVDRFPTTSNVFFVTCYRAPDWKNQDKVTQYARWMRQIAKARSNVHLIDWRKQVQSGNVRLSDGIHPERGAGEVFWARLVNSRVVSVNR